MLGWDLAWGESPRIATLSLANPRRERQNCDSDHCAHSRRLSPASRANSRVCVGYLGVPLRSTPGFMLSPASQAYLQMKKHILIYGICGGLLIVVLKLIEYRFLIIERSIEIYGGLIALLFASVGIWLGLKLTKNKETVVVKEVPVEVTVEVPVPTREPFVLDQTRLQQLGITARELEILQLIAGGMSTREIAEKLFVSENTVKTHSSRLLDKLNAKRRTQAVQIAKELRLIP